jgi:hypothetical protein
MAEFMAKFSEDTGKIELNKIVNCLKENNYVFTGLENAEDMYGYMNANFEKEIKYADKKGNSINDRHIKIKIEFDSDFDYKNNYRDNDGEFEFDGNKGTTFIENLVNDSYGGSRKRIIKRKNTRKSNRKTKKLF